MARQKRAGRVHLDDGATRADADRLGQHDPHAIAQKSDRPQAAPSTLLHGTNVPAELVEKLTNAVARVNAAEEVVADTEKAATEAKDLRDARSLELGKLLLEAKSLHASKETFDAFLDRFVVLQPSRAYDYIRIARGKTTAEELKKEQRERKAKSRKKKELAKSKPAEPLPDSVTNGSVTESGEIGTAPINRDADADHKRAEFAAVETAETSAPDTIVGRDGKAPPTRREIIDRNRVERFKESLCTIWGACNVATRLKIPPNLD